MQNHTYRTVEIVGTADTTIDDAIRNGVERAGHDIKHIEWFEVTQIRGAVRGGKVNQFQVVLKLAARFDD